MFSHAEVYPAVVAALLRRGRPVTEIEGGERGGRIYKGDRAQARRRNDRVWHTKRSVDEYVAKRLGIGQSVWGAGRSTNEFQQATATTIIKLRKAGKLVDWAKGRRYNIYRLAADHGLRRPRLHRADSGGPVGGRRDACRQRARTDDDRMALFMRILKDGAKNGTYKFALARALLELCSERDPGASGPYIIKYEKLAERFLRYYWRQECVFHIRQNYYNDKEAAVIRAIRGKWGKMTYRDDFDKLDADDVRDVTSEIEHDVFGSERAKKSVVVPKFQRVKCGRYVEEVEMFYTRNAKKRQITVRAAACSFFRRNYDVLKNAVAFEWARYLEGANGGLPGLIAKVESAQTTPSRNPAYIKRAKDALLTPRTKCFYCRCKLDRKVPCWTTSFRGRSYSTTSSGTLSPHVAAATPAKATSCQTRGRTTSWSSATRSVRRRSTRCPSRWCGSGVTKTGKRRCATSTKTVGAKGLRSCRSAGYGRASAAASARTRSSCAAEAG